MCIDIDIQNTYFSLVCVNSTCFVSLCGGLLWSMESTLAGSDGGVIGVSQRQSHGG